MDNITNCSICLEKFPSGTRPLGCLQCGASFELPSGGSGDFPVNPLILDALASATRQQAAVCEGCEKTQAAEHCEDCSLAFCQACKKAHLKPKATAHHHFVPVDDTFHGVRAGARITRCQRHLHLEINSYCGKCQESVCSECVVDFHIGHPVERLVAVAARFKEEISAKLSKVFLPFFPLPSSLFPLPSSLFPPSGSQMCHLEFINNKYFFKNLKIIRLERATCPTPFWS